MLRMKPKAKGASSPVSGRGFEASGGWEMRPGGMLVQKRNSDANLNSNTVPNIQVNVKYGASFHEVIISSQASFGELKKILSGRTGLNTQDQKLVFKEKERDSKDFLDFCGVKNGSKVLLLEDEFSKHKRRAEAKMDKALEDIAAIRFQVDNLAKQVASAEVEINVGKKVEETVLLTLIEQLMTQLIKLDGISADGEVKLQRRMQVKRVQKYIEILDVLKIRNSGLGKQPLQQCRTPISFQKQKEQKKQGSLIDAAGTVVVTTKWETF